jgi:hypothetical protein
VIASVPAAVNTASKAAVNFRVPVADEKPEPVGLLIKVGQRITRRLGNPRAGRVGSDAGQVDPTVIEFDHEQDVPAGQPDGLDGEQIAGERCAGLRTRELRPGWAVAAGCRSEMMTAQNLSVPR